MGIRLGGRSHVAQFIVTAINELREELGLEVQPSDLQLLSEWRSSTRPAPDFINNSFMTLYLLRTDREVADFTMQKSEISDLKYISVSKLKQRIAEDNPEFVPHAHAYAELFAALA